MYYSYKEIESHITPELINAKNDKTFRALCQNAVKNIMHTKKNLSLHLIQNIRMRSYDNLRNRHRLRRTTKRKRRIDIFLGKLLKEHATNPPLINKSTPISLEPPYAFADPVAFGHQLLNKLAVANKLIDPDHNGKPNYIETALVSQSVQELCKLKATLLTRACADYGIETISTEPKTTRKQIIELYKSSGEDITISLIKKIIKSTRPDRKNLPPLLKQGAEP